MNATNQLGKEMDTRNGHQRRLNIEHALVVGDKVRHTLTGMCGTVIETAQVGDVQNVSVEMSNGKILTKLARQEFVLDAGPVHVSKPETEVAVVPMPTLSGPVDAGSILDQLC